MDQFKCGEIYRDAAGKVVYTCLECPADFESAPEYEEHLPMHYDDITSEEVTLIKIEALDEDELDGIHGETETLEESDAFGGEIEVLEEYVTEYDKIVKCHCCDEYYACRGLIEQHLRTTEDPDKKCDECPAYFEKKNELIAHQLIHNDENAIPCQHCYELFATERKLEEHLAPQLTKTQPSKRKRDEEPATDESKSKSKYRCDICAKEYTYIHYLKEHLKKHSNNTLLHTCETCGHEFKLRQNLLAHQRIHTGRLKAKARSQSTCLSKFNLSLLFSARRETLYL